MAQNQLPAEQLRDAIRSGNLPAVLAVVESNPTVVLEPLTTDGQTAIQYAGHYFRDDETRAKMAADVLSHSTNINGLSPSNITALHVAISCNNRAMVQALLCIDGIDPNANIFAPDGSRVEHPLQTAVELNGDLDITLHLVRHPRTNLSLTCWKAEHGQPGPVDTTPAHLIIERTNVRSHPVVLEALRGPKLIPGMTDWQGNTALHAAAQCGAEDVICAILGNPNVEDCVLRLTNQQQLTAVDVALKNGFCDCALQLSARQGLSLIAQPDIDFSQPNSGAQVLDLAFKTLTAKSNVGWSLLHCIVAAGDAQRWQKVRRLAGGAFAQLCSTTAGPHAGTVLHTATRHDQREMIREILGLGLHHFLMTEDHRKQIPLHTCAATPTCSLETFDMLLQGLMAGGLLLQMQDTEGNTVLHAAAGRKDGLAFLFSLVEFDKEDFVKATGVANAAGRLPLDLAVLKIVDTETCEEYMPLVHMLVAHHSPYAAPPIAAVARCGSLYLWHTLWARDSLAEWSAQRQHVAPHSQSGLPHYGSHTTSAACRVIHFGLDTGRGRTLAHELCSAGVRSDVLGWILKTMEESQGWEEINQKDEDGTTPLHEAALHGDESLIFALLSLQADPTIANRAGLLPLHYTLKRGLLEVSRCQLKTLRERKITLNLTQTDSDGIAIGHLLAEDRAQLLLCAGTVGIMLEGVSWDADPSSDAVAALLLSCIKSGNVSLTTSLLSLPGINANSALQAIIPFMHRGLPSYEQILELLLRRPDVKLCTGVLNAAFRLPWTEEGMPSAAQQLLYARPEIGFDPTLGVTLERDIVSIIEYITTRLANAYRSPYTAYPPLGVFVDLVCHVQPHMSAERAQALLKCFGACSSYVAMDLLVARLDFLFQKGANPNTIIRMAGQREVWMPLLSWFAFLKSLEGVAVLVRQPSINLLQLDNDKRTALRAAMFALKSHVGQVDRERFTLMVRLLLRADPKQALDVVNDTQHGNVIHNALESMTKMDGSKAPHSRLVRLIMGRQARGGGHQGVVKRDRF